MRLSRLELSGFKSFAGSVELPFDQGVTAIVGPNGCGKSNISDAVRWVLGEQSPRLLRGGKMEDVIFQGSTGRRPVNVAEVSLVFDNSDGTLPIAYHCAFAYGVKTNIDARVAVHSLAGCFLYGAIAAKLLIVRSRRLPGWALPLAGGILVALVAVLWYTSALWYFNNYSLPSL